MIFLIICLGVLIIYFYTGWRLITPLRIKGIYRLAAWSAFVMLPLLLPISYYLRFHLDAPIPGDLLACVGYTSLGFFSFVFTFLVLRDVTRALAHVTSLLRRGHADPPPTRPTGFEPSRRRFLERSFNLGILGLSGLLTGYGIVEARRRPTIVRLNVKLRRLPREFEGFRIAQISDIHVGPTIKRDYVGMVVDQTNLLGADLIAFTGDLADGPVSILSNDVEPLQDLSAPYGKFFVTGNHEYYSGVLQWIEEIERLGFSVLINSHQQILKGPARLVLAGVTDYQAGRFIESHASSPGKALSGAPRDTPSILLAHQPRSIASAARAGADLQLSGHTHGGQYFYGDLLVALSQPYLKGLHRYDETTIYVNSGTGYWGPPLRLGVPSEITLITLTDCSNNKT
jgi:hypothetical protein